MIAGATKPDQIAANAAAGEWVLNPAEVAEVDSIASAKWRRGGLPSAPLDRILERSASGATQR